METIYEKPTTICRACLGDKGKMHFLFNDKQLAEILVSCTQIQVKDKG